MTRWRTRGAVGLTAALSLGLLISTTSGFSQADDRLPDVLSCEQYLAADPATVPAGRTVLVPAATACELTDVALPGDVVVAPGGDLTLTSSSVAGTLTADAAHRVTLTDVSVAGAVTSTAAGTVPGPVVDPAAAPVTDPAAVLPVVSLTRVDAERTIDISGTVGGIVVAGTDLLGTLTVADTTGDLLVAAADQPVPVADPAPGVDGTAVADTTGDVIADGETASAVDGTPAAPAEAADEPALPPVRTLVGTDLQLSRNTGAIVVDGTTVTGQVRLLQNSAAPLFGPAATVAGGVVQVQPDPAPPVVPSPAPEQPAEPDPETTAPPAETTDEAPVSTAPTTSVPAAPVDGGGPGATGPADATDGADPTSSDTGGGADPASTGAASPASPSATAGRPGSSSAEADPDTDSAPETDTDSPAAASSTGPVLPDGLTVDFGPTALVDLGSLRPVQGLMTADGSLSPVSLTDTREGAPGWSVSAQLTDFAGGDRFIGAANLGWTPRLIDAESGAELGPDIAPGAASGEGLSVIRRLGSAAPGEGSGTTVLGADLRLQLSEPVDPGTYTATLVITVLS